MKIPDDVGKDPKYLLVILTIDDGLDDQIFEDVDAADVLDVDGWVKDYDDDDDELDIGDNDNMGISVVELLSLNTDDDDVDRRFYIS